MDETANPADLWAAWSTRRDERAFETLVRPEIPALCDAARRWGLQPADADDVIQDVLGALARERGPRPGAVGVGAWLMRATRFRALNRKRAETRRKKHEQRPQPRPAPDERPSGFDVPTEVEHALAAMADEDREVLLLRFVYDLEYRELAYVLGISENACRIRVHRASGRLRERLGSRGLALLSAIPLLDLPTSGQWIATATHTGSGLGWASIGGIAMGTGAKMAASALVAAALTAGVFMVADPGRAPVEVRREGASRPEDAVPSGNDLPTLAGRGAASLPELAPSEAESVWLRNALLRERQRQADAMERPEDSGLDILRRVFEHDMDPWPLLADFGRFAAHVRPGSGTAATFRATEATTPVDLAKVDAAVQVLEFGPGTFRVTGLQFRPRNESVSHLEIRGAGMDKTTLLIEGRQTYMVLAPHPNVRIHDLTLDFQDNGMLFDVRDGLAAILEDVRLKDWTAGSGHSAAIGVSGTSYLGCRRCTFETSNPDHGFAVSLRGPAVAVFEGCTFLGGASAFIGTPSDKAGSVRVSKCVFEDTPLADSRVVVRETKPIFAIRLENSTARFGPKEWSEEMRRERWGATYATSIQGLDLSASLRNVSTRELARLLRLAELPNGSFIESATVNAWKAGEPTRLQLDVLPSEGFVTLVYALRKDEDGGWHTERLTRAGGHTVTDADKLRTQPDLLDVLERARPPSTTSIGEARYAWTTVRTSNEDAGRTVATVMLGMRDGPPTLIDPVTGEPR